MDHVEYREFEAMCYDKDSIIETIETYNKIYNKDFKLIEYIEEIEVGFAHISGNVSLQDIFDLGCQYINTVNENLKK